MYHKEDINVLSVLALYPVMVLVDAGFMATTLNYLWPLTFGLAAIYISLKDIYIEKNKWLDWTLCLFALIYSANTEQMAVILLMFYSAMIFISRIKKPMVFLEWLICVSGILYDFYANFFKDNPRFARETSRYFETFTNLNPVQKFELGFSSTFLCLSMKICVISIPFVIFLAFLVYVTFKKYNTWSKRLPSAFLLTITLTASLLSIFPNCTIYKFISGGYINYKMNMAIYSFSPMPDIIFLTILILLLISIWFVIDDFEKRKNAFFILFCGIISRIMMGFSPTVWASGYRTFTIFLVSLVFIAIMIVNENSSIFNSKGGTYEKEKNNNSSCVSTAAGSDCCWSGSHQRKEQNN